VNALRIAPLPFHLRIDSSDMFSAGYLRRKPDRPAPHYALLLYLCFGFPCWITSAESCRGSLMAFMILNLAYSWAAAGGLVDRYLMPAYFLALFYIAQSMRTQESAGAIRPSWCRLIADRRVAAKHLRTGLDAAPASKHVPLHSRPSGINCSGNPENARSGLWVAASAGRAETRSGSTGTCFLARAKTLHAALETRQRQHEPAIGP